MNALTRLLTAAGAGAVSAYYWDPDLGNRRRALMRDQIQHALNKSRRAVDVTQRDLQHRLQGTYAELTGCLSATGETDSEVLADRVRSKLGRYTSHPAAIEVVPHDGRVELRGPILANEVENVVAAARSVRGVRAVENHLDVHESADISDLQGGVRPAGEPFEFMQTNWSPTARLLATTAGFAMMLRCLTLRRSPLSPLVGIAGTALVLRGLTNLEFGRLFSDDRGRRIDIDSMSDRKIESREPPHDPAVQRPQHQEV